MVKRGAPWQVGEQAAYLAGVAAAVLSEAATSRGADHDGGGPFVDIWADTRVLQAITRYLRLAGSEVPGWDAALMLPVVALTADALNTMGVVLLKSDAGPQLAMPYVEVAAAALRLAMLILLPPASMATGGHACHEVVPVLLLPGS